MDDENTHLLVRSVQRHSRRYWIDHSGPKYVSSNLNSSSYDEEVVEKNHELEESNISSGSQMGTPAIGKTEKSTNLFKSTCRLFLFSQHGIIYVFKSGEQRRNI